MGSVKVDTVVIGSFSPQQVGSSGNVRINGTVIGTYDMDAETGNVLINTTVIGSFTAEPVTPPVVVGWIGVPMIGVSMFKGVDIT